MPPLSLRALIARPPSSTASRWIGDVLIGGGCAPSLLLLCRSSGGEHATAWVDPPWATLTHAAADPSPPEVEHASRGADEFGELIAHGPLELLAGTVQRLEFEAGASGDDLVFVRLKLDDGDVVRTLLAPAGWLARREALPVIGIALRVRAAVTRDGRGLLWVAGTVQQGEQDELVLRDDQGAPLWNDPPWMQGRRSAFGLLGRAVLAGPDPVGEVEDLGLDPGSGRPQTFVVRASSDVAAVVRLPWRLVSRAADGALTVAPETWRVYLERATEESRREDPWTVPPAASSPSSNAFTVEAFTFELPQGVLRPSTLLALMSSP